MARLNEPPAAPAVPATVLAGGVGGPESVDALKRRFIRQNRELAKNNSSQSLRIRSLEIDVSRLLQTNLELREELLRARSAEQDARRQSTKEGVRGFKEEMMAKLKELSGIVEGIEEKKEDRADEMLEREERRMSVLSQMEFRERQPLADLMRDCQMPTIDEDKIHARRTLEAAEIKAIRLSDGSSNESPDLGPPPVARFECQDPIKFDARTAAEPERTEVEPLTEPTQAPESESENKPNDEDLPASLSVNLETRRKRKDSQPKLELRRHSILPPPSPSSSEAETGTSALRTGAKRKLADRDLDKPAKGPSKTDFTFNRKSSTEPTKTPLEAQPEPEKSPENVEIQAPAPQSARKVLGDKSVNMSPRKAVASPDKPNGEDVKKPSQPKFGAVKDRTNARKSRLSVIPPPQPEPEVSVATVELPALQSPALTQEPALHTPAAPDLFSPTPELSAAPNERAATPPPAGLSTSTTETARPSRRARSAVNYAEPSLGAKMRRQEKGMMDAVTGLQHHRRAMNESAEKKARNAVLIKKEPEDEDAWKNLPSAGEATLSAARSRAASPLESKSGSVNNLDSIVRPESQDSNGTSTVEQAADVQKPSARVLAQPSSQRRVRQPAAAQDKLPAVSTAAGTDLDDAARKIQELNLYDFKDSSSSMSPATSTADQAATAAPKAAPARSHRRHSSIPKDALKAASSGGETKTSASRTATATASSRRRSMMT